MKGQDNMYPPTDRASVEARMKQNINFNAEEHFKNNRAPRELEEQPMKPLSRTDAPNAPENQPKPPEEVTFTVPEEVPAYKDPMVEPQKTVIVQPEPVEPIITPDEPMPEPAPASDMSRYMRNNDGTSNNINSKQENKTNSSFLNKYLRNNGGDNTDGEPQKFLKNEGYNGLDTKKDVPDAVKRYKQSLSEPDISDKGKDDDDGLGL